MSEEQLKKDYETLNIIDIENISVRFVTGKYKRLAKQRHPDKEGGTKVDFQELQPATLRGLRERKKTMKEIFSWLTTCVKKVLSVVWFTFEIVNVRRGKQFWESIYLFIRVIRKESSLKLVSSLSRFMIHLKLIPDQKFMSKVETSELTLNL